MFGEANKTSQMWLAVVISLVGLVECQKLVINIVFLLDLHVLLENFMKSFGSFFLRKFLLEILRS